MKSLSVIVGALVLVGCQGGSTPTPEPPPEPAPDQTTPKPTPTPTTTTTPEQSDPNYITERLHQLKDFPKATIEINGHKLNVYLALNESNRAEGLMHVLDKHLKIDEGMLFAFSDEQPRSFWMQNTKIDLDLAYISKAGKIVSTHRMKALDESPVPGKGPAMYVLEVKPGAFEQFGIQAGQTVKIPPTVKSED